MRNLRYLESGKQDVEQRLARLLLARMFEACRHVSTEEHRRLTLGFRRLFRQKVSGFVDSPVSVSEDQNQQANHEEDD